MKPNKGCEKGKYTYSLKPDILFLLDLLSGVLFDFAWNLFRSFPKD